MTKWNQIHRDGKHDHRYFTTDERPGMVAVADNSGATPDRTEDGVLWIDCDRPIRVGATTFMLPVYGPRALGSWTGGSVEHLPALLAVLRQYGYSMMKLEPDETLAARSIVRCLELHPSRLDQAVDNPRS